MSPSADAAKQTTTAYEALLTLPGDVVGEIINGSLVVSPRPSGPNIGVASTLGFELGPPYQLGRGGGPGDWWILDEPEVELAHGEHHVVPDLAGWRKERMPELPTGHVFTVVPDWVCEVISPASVRRDRVEKLHIYGRFGVGFYWLIDPLAKTLEAFELKDGRWVSVGAFSEAAKVRVPPFDGVELELGALWSQVDKKSEP